MINTSNLVPMRPLFLSLALVTGAANAQLINGSFEDALGVFSDSGWVSTCAVDFAAGAPGCGSASILVPHGNTTGCGWSRLYQLVPAIGDGETWTLSGWCANFAWFIADPYIGFRFGVKDAQGNLSFNTPALQNTGNWTFLSVTNTFTLAPGDTVFVECEPGSLTELGLTLAQANFDGLELTSLATGLEEAAQGPVIHLHPQPADEVLRVACDAPVLEVRAFTAGGQVLAPSLRTFASGTMELDLTGLPSGMHVLWVRTAEGVRAERFLKR